jgi:hypothetical protein
MRHVTINFIAGYAAFIGAVGMASCASGENRLAASWIGAGAMSFQTALCITLLGIAIILKESR